MSFSMNKSPVPLTQLQRRKPQPHPRKSNSIPLKSVDDTVKRLISFLESDPCDTDLLLRISPEIASSDKVSSILRSAAEAKWRYTYDTEYQILKVFSMSRPIHDAFQLYLNLFVKHMIPFLTPEQVFQLNLHTTEQVMSGIAATLGGKKVQAWDKRPDALVVFGNPVFEQVIPTIVVEVGFSESYQDLINDTRQWLTKTETPLALVILVKIEENTIPLQHRKSSPGFASTFRRLLLKYGDERAYAEGGIQGTAVDEASFSRAALESDIVTSDWVGDIKVYLELWERHNNDIRLREPRCNILPEPTSSHDPTIRITDLIPDGCRARFGASFDASRTVTMDMSMLRPLLVRERDNLALHRATRAFRPGRRAGASDPDYSPN
ncbi:hypothetical protein BJY01DRAFT_175228 [Aspergillus pseudoustus]|uniref:Uncharacterized protein n=1 Tax=Aspergillus pseudoustus TaxID=1810923 RepID=A0ABR4K303_9EURO